MSKNILLINPVFTFDKYLVDKYQQRRLIPRSYPPFGLLQIGGYLKKNGYYVDIIDGNIHSNLFLPIDKILSSKKVLCVGFTVKTGPPLLQAMQLSFYIKSKYPEVNIVWGGIFPTILPEETLQQSFADFVIVDQGEESMLALCNALLSEKPVYEIPGVAFLKKNVVHLTPQAAFVKYFPADWSLIEKDLNFKQKPYIASVLISRGCPFKCSFCYNRSKYNINNNYKWSPIDNERVLRDVDALLKYEMNVFNFLDDCTLMNKKRIIPLINEFKKRKIYIEQCISHVRTITPEIIEAIGPIVQQISYSIETVSSRLQKILNKKISTQEIIKADRLLAYNDINTIHNFIVGIPEETDDDLRMNIELAVLLRQINPFIRFTAMFCVPYPKSDLEKWVKDHMGYKIPYDLRLLSTVSLFNLNVNPVVQPWLMKAEKKEFYEKFMRVFEAIFYNPKDLSFIKSILCNNKRLYKIFEPALKLPKLETNFPYILNKLINDRNITYPQAKEKFLTKWRLSELNNNETN